MMLINKKGTSFGTIVAVFVSILVIVIGFFVYTKSSSIIGGNCYHKRCYDFNDPASCNNNKLGLKCVWGREDNYDTKSYCMWISEDCSTHSKNSCEDDKECIWREPYCDKKGPCEEYIDNKKSCQQHEECQWR